MAMNLDQTVDKITPSTGGLSVAGLIANATTVATSWSIPTGYSAITVGPMTINSGVTVTVASGQRWVVL
jgi:hypothetical protein